MTSYQKAELDLVIKRLDMFQSTQSPVKHGVESMKHFLIQPMQSPDDGTILDYVQKGLAYKVYDWIANGCPYTFLP